jgi:hypothetical protein
VRAHALQEEFIEGGYLYIAMGYCEGGDLYRRLRGLQGNLLPEWQVIEWAIQVRNPAIICKQRPTMFHSVLLASLVVHLQLRLMPETHAN